MLRANPMRLWVSVRESCIDFTVTNNLLNVNPIRADTFMSKTARLYQDSRAANAASSHLDRLNDDLQDVTRIMTKNMEELLWRGDSLDRMCLVTPNHIFPI